MKCCAASSSATCDDFRERSVYLIARLRRAGPRFVSPNDLNGATRLNGLNYLNRLRFYSDIVPERLLIRVWWGRRSPPASLSGYTQNSKAVRPFCKPETCRGSGTNYAWARRISKEKRFDPKPDANPTNESPTPTASRRSRKLFSYPRGVKVVRILPVYANSVAEARGIHTLCRDHFILYELSHR
jgi:hypothetical protein